MVAPFYLVEDVSGNEMIDCRFGGEEVVESPSDIPFPSRGTITPPGVAVFGVGVEMSEGVSKTGLDEQIHLVALFVGEARAPAIGFRAGDIDLFVGDIEVTAVENRLFGGEGLEVCAGAGLPKVAAIVEPEQLAFAIWNVRVDEVERLVLGGDHPSFTLKLGISKIEFDGEGFFFREDSRPGIAGLLSGVENLVGIFAKVQFWRPIPADLGFLKAEDVRGSRLDGFGEPFFYAGAQPVYVPGD